MPLGTSPIILYIDMIVSPGKPPKGPIDIQGRVLTVVKGDYRRGSLLEVGPLEGLTDSGADLLQGSHPLIYT